MENVVESDHQHQDQNSKDAGNLSGTVSPLRNNSSKPDSLDAVMDLEKSDHVLFNVSPEKVKELQNSNEEAKQVKSELVASKVDTRLSMEDYTAQVLEIGSGASQVADKTQL